MSPRFFTWVFVFAAVGAFAVGTIIHYCLKAHCGDFRHI